MYAENARVKPTTLHANAALLVCSRASDLDALWGIVARMPDSGSGTPDGTTYTTILNAIRHHALTTTSQLTDEDDVQRAARYQKAIIDGRRVWDDVVAKWRAGEIIIDESLVCAMGRLLLLSTDRREWSDVFLLIRQSMNIPIPADSLPKPPTHKNRPGSQDASMTTATLESEALDLSASEQSDSQFDSEVSTQKKSHVPYARYSNNTLSLILEACLKMNAKRTATVYWRFFCDPDQHALVPDPANFHYYLSLLRLYRSDKEAAELLQSDTAEKSGALKVKKTYRAAMGVCFRNKKSPNALEHAEQILNLMCANLAEPEIVAVGQYVDLVHMRSDPRKLDRALSKLDPVVANLKSLLNYGNESGNKLSKEDQEEILRILRKVVACYHRLIETKDQPPQRLKYYMQTRHSLSAYIQRWSAKGEQKTMDFTVPRRDPQKYADAKATLRTRKRQLRLAKQKIARARGDSQNSQKRKVQDDEIGTHVD